MKTPRLLRLALFLISAFQLFSVSAFSQGSLTPPGPPAPTMKRLDELEPRTNLQATPAPAGVDTSNADYHFIINQPGSYYLSANLLVTKTHGLRVSAPGVTLDLNGFEISQVNPSGNGIEVVPTADRVTIRNGTVKGFVYGIGSSAKASAFRDLAVTGCTSYGILAFSGAVLEFCRAHDNSGTAGIYAGAGSTLSNCTASGNTTTFGINTAAGCVLSNCSAYLNTGIYGISVWTGCSLTNCSATSNTGTGTTSAGFSTGYGCSLTHCTAAYNTTNAASTATTGMGFNLFAGSTIRNCVAENNRGDGIRVTASCLVLENNCEQNAAGVHSTESNNRIEANNLISNGRGINVDATGSLIIRNSASNNTTDYVIAANNRYGPIIDISAAGAPAVNGKSAADTTTASHPLANLSY
jgi:parallel beta-helix repeat protein